MASEDIVVVDFVAADTNAISTQHESELNGNAEESKKEQSPSTSALMREENGWRRMIQQFTPSWVCLGDMNMNLSPTLIVYALTGLHS